jgi:hypothetical protein
MDYDSSMELSSAPRNRSRFIDARHAVSLNRKKPTARKT